MKLLKSEVALRRWLLKDGGAYRSDIKRRDYPKPKSYPCYGYLVVESYAYEKQEPLFLYPADLKIMLKKINEISL